MPSQFHAAWEFVVEKGTGSTQQKVPAALAAGTFWMELQDDRQAVSFSSSFANAGSSSNDFLRAIL